jgi:hypothetical protein
MSSHTELLQIALMGYYAQSADCSWSNTISIWEFITCSLKKIKIGIYLFIVVI